MTVGTANLHTRERWLEATLAAIPAGSRILDAGAGEQKYQKFCSHLDYVAQDFGRYDGRGDSCGLQRESWDLVENGNYFEYLAQEVRRIATVSQRYASGRPRLWDRLALRVVLNMLQRFSARDQGSSELLHYGCFVRATKK